MIKDITIGQYFPGKSVLHKMDARMKIIVDIIYVVILFVAGNFWALGIAAAFVIMAYGISEIKFIMILKSLKPIIPLILFTAILNLVFVQGEGDPLLSWWIITVYAEGVQTSLFMVIRIVCLIVGMSLLTYTTSPIVLTDAIENLMSPLKVVKFPVHELAMMMTIALRFIPTLVEETDKIMMAQKARGANLDTGGLVKKAKALVPILIPLFISSFKRANELATAMECRCYRGGEGRTKLRRMKLTALDIMVFMLVAVTFGLVIVNNIAF